MQELAQNHAHGTTAYGPSPVLSGEGSAHPYDHTVTPQSPTLQSQVAPHANLSNLDEYLEHHTKHLVVPQAQAQPSQHQHNVTAANNLQKARELAEQSAAVPLEGNCPQLSSEARQEAGRELARQASS